jgi:hypothetical protein
MRGALLLACIAACGGGTGVDIDIYAPDGVTLDKVELWVAYDDCHDCPNGVAWTENVRASGDIYLLRDEKVIAAKPYEGRWVIHLEAVDGNRDPIAIAVVGYQGAQAKAIEVMRYVHIPSSSVEIWKVFLRSADPATPEVSVAPGASASDYRAHIWPRRPTSALADRTGCLAYQKWNDYDATWETEYFVPESDPDCDGHTIECSDFWFDYKPIGQCISDTMEIAGTCSIGRSGCADGVSGDATCSQDPAQPFTCLPDAFCAKCAGELPADTCIENAINSAFVDNELPHYECSFDESSQGGSCSNLFIPLQLPHVNAVCATPSLHYIEKPFSEPQSSVSFGTGEEKVTFTLSPDMTTPCLYALKATGTSQVAFTQSEVTFLINVPYTNGTRAIYPVHIHSTHQTVICGMNPFAGICVPKGPSDDGVATCAAK